MLNKIWKWFWSKPTKSIDPEFKINPEDVMDPDPYVREIVARAANTNKICFGSVDEDGIFRIKEAED